MLRSSPPARHQLQEEEVWTHESVEAQEEAEVEWTMGMLQEAGL